jgi:hypothetical protein
VAQHRYSNRRAERQFLRRVFRRCAAKARVSPSEGWGLGPQG